MAPFSFKLADPANQNQPDTADVPRWLEDHIGKVNSENDEHILGDVDTTLLTGELFNDMDYSDSYGISPSYHYIQQPTANLNQIFWENTEDGFETFDGTSETNHLKNPKDFCDSVYVRLMNVMFVISDEKQAFAVQKEFEKLVCDIENEVLKK